MVDGKQNMSLLPNFVIHCYLRIIYLLSPLGDLHRVPA